MERIETSPGEHILEALNRASGIADGRGEPVGFTFNGIEHDVHPWESPDSYKARAEERCGYKILTREEAAEEARQSLERRQAEADAAIAAAGLMDETAMREAEVPSPASEEELTTYIRSMVDRPHDYGTCVYAMSMAATAAFRYVAKKLGVTGFQASCADMDVLRRIRGMKHGFQIIDYADALYPQYWDDERRPVYEALMRKPETRQRFREAAERLLAASPHAHADVRRHWETLAAGNGGHDARD
jgi:hypothetical protein